MGETFGEQDVIEQKVGPDFEEDPGQTEEGDAVADVEAGDQLTADQIKLLKAIRTAATKKEKGADFAVHIIEIAQEHGATDMMTAAAALTEKLTELQGLGYVTRDGSSDNWALTPKGLNAIGNFGA